MLQLSRMIIKKLINMWRLVFKIKYIFIANLIVFGFLLFRNPFSERTLIPNLEPYPDTIHYTSPPMTLVRGGPFMINREGRTFKTTVSPLYSITLTPFYLVNYDVRMFYYANVLMSLLSLWLFYSILKKITGDKLILGFTLFLFVTNYYIYWFPQWAMAENLFMPIFLLGIWLLMSRLRLVNIFLASFVTIAFYAVKKACAPLTIIYAIVFLTKIFVEKASLQVKLKNTLLFIIFLLIIFLPLYWYNIVFLKENPFGVILGLINSTSGLSNTKNLTDSSLIGGSWFSMHYIKTNLPLYLKAIIGDRARFLWDFTPIVSSWIGILGLIGFGCSLFVSRLRLMTIALIFLLGGEVLFISSFYAFDMRYVYHAIPTLLLGFSFLLSFLRDYFKKKKKYYIFICLIIILFGNYFVKNAIRIKSQIMINIRYAETPWYYISVLRLNDYFGKDKVVEGKKPIVISSMPPYYIDYYSNGNYELLPLSNKQEFRDGMNKAWGDHDYSNLHKIYADYLRSGRSVYVSTYGLGNEAYLHAEFKDLKKDFIITEVYNGCYTQCAIYKLNLKK